jgi:eukaryotic-like serine/threonine-protein kinase
MTPPITPARWQRLAALLDEALDLSPGERLAWLARVGEQDPTLREDLSQLLESDAEAGDFLLGSADSFLPVIGSEDSGTADLAAVGSMIGPYRVVRVIAQGGMGTVFLAARADGQFEQEVALKLVRAGKATPDIMGRFKIERQILARLNHPSIARLLDGGVTAGEPWFAMELVDGAPLTAWCDDRRLDRPARLALFERVCEAVQYAHQNHVIHRDLKPSNIMVAGDGQVKLLDFGIAKLVDDALPGDPRRKTTKGDLRMLTPEYAAPEQVRGDPVTAATDVYALGAILYELLTGERAHRFSRRTPAEVVRVVCEKPPHPPGLGVELDGLVLRALHKDPGQRHRSVAALLEALRALHQPAGRGGQVDRLVRLLRRHPIVSTSTAAIGITLAIIAVSAARHAAAATGEASEERAVHAFITALFDTGARRLTAGELLSRGRPRADSIGDPALRARILGVLGLMERNLGDLAAADSLLRQSVELTRSARGPGDPAMAARLSELGSVLRAKGQVAEADSIEAEVSGVHP